MSHYRYDPALAQLTILRHGRVVSRIAVFHAVQADSIGRALRLLAA